MDPITAKRVLREVPDPQIVQPGLKSVPEGRGARFPLLLNKAFMVAPDSPMEHSFPTREGEEGSDMIENLMGPAGTMLPFQQPPTKGFQAGVALVLVKPKNGAECFSPFRPGVSKEFREVPQATATLVDMLRLLPSEIAFLKDPDCMFRHEDLSVGKSKQVAIGKLS
jgi:hypothetical protein